jgi:hypothetical protein
LSEVEAKDWDDEENVRIVRKKLVKGVDSSMKDEDESV